MEYKFFAEKLISSQKKNMFMFFVIGIFAPFMLGFALMSMWAVSFWKKNPQVIITEEYITINQGPIRAAGRYILSEIESISWTKKRQCIITHEGQDKKFMLGSLSDHSFETVKTALENTVAANG